MTAISTLLDSLFANDDDMANALEKTAEDHLLDALRSDGAVAENPYAHMSTAELQALISEDDVPEMLAEKTAGEMLRGQIMAHALVHEMSLIKQACAAGLCRVCKENQFDVEGSTICSTCSEQAS